MAASYFPAEDLIIRIIDGCFVVTNVHARRHLRVSLEVLELLAFMRRGKGFGEIKKKIGADINKYSCASRTRFTLGKGLVCNSDNLSDDDDGGEERFQDAASLVGYMENNHLVYSSREDYLDYFKQKKSLLDNKHMGNFHQQLSRHALVTDKKAVDDWWVRQKFQDDLNGIRDNPYKFVEEAFVREYFTRDKVAGKRILDIGCGIGYYDNLLAERGAEVLGIDPNVKYIARASEKYGRDGLKFEQVDVAKDGLISIEKGCYDAVLLSDTLLFYFVAPNPKEPPMEVVSLLREIGEVLKPDGSLYVLEPHGAFFLQGWYGAPDRPYLVMTEYRNRVFRVVPTLEEISAAFAKAGYVIKEIREPKICDDARRHDEKAFHVCGEFPLWWFFHLKKA